MSPSFRIADTATETPALNQSQETIVLRRSRGLHIGSLA